MTSNEKETEATLVRARAIIEEHRKREERLKSKYKDFLRGCDLGKHHFLPLNAGEYPDEQRIYLTRAADELGISLRYHDSIIADSIEFQVNPPIQQELQKVIVTLRERDLPTDRLERELDQGSKERTPRAVKRYRKGYRADGTLTAKSRAEAKLLAMTGDATAIEKLAADKALTAKLQADE